MNQKTPTKNGFTLIEIMSAMAVFSIMLLMILRIFTASSTAMTKGSQLSKMDTDARLALDFIEAKLSSHWMTITSGSGAGGSSVVECFTLDRTNCEQVGEFFINTSPNASTQAPNRKALFWKDTIGGGGGLSNMIMDDVLQFNVTLFDDVSPTTTANDGIVDFIGCTGTGASTVQTSLGLAVVDLRAVTSAVAIRSDSGATGYDPEEHMLSFRRNIYLPLKDFSQ